MESVTLFGERSRVAAEVGRPWQRHQQLRRVDLWAADRHLTCDDNTAFVPQFVLGIEKSIAAIRSGSLVRPQFSDDDMRRRVLGEDAGSSFPGWGPTTDNVRGVLAQTKHADRLEFAFRFWRPTHPIVRERGTVFSVEIATEELVAVLTRVIDLLRRDAPLSTAP